MGHYDTCREGYCGRCGQMREWCDCKDAMTLVQTYNEFVKAGGTKTFSDDRRTLISTLPEPYEFGPGIISPDEISKRENAARIAGLKEAVEIAEQLAKDNWGFAARESACDEVATSIRARISALEKDQK